MDAFVNVDNPLFALVLLGSAVCMARFCRTCIVPVPVAKTPAVYYETLEGLRGLLAILVFIHHANTTAHLLRSGDWEAPPTRFFSQLGQPAVAVFFMLTAFLFWDRVLRERGQIVWSRFFVARIMRLVPVYLVAIGLVTLMVFAVSGWALHEPVGALLHHIAAWAVFTITGLPDINGLSDTWRLTAGVTWSLRFEWIFYVALPLLGFLLARTKQYWAATVSLLGILLYLVVGHFTLAADGVKFLPFLGGFVAAYWIRSPHLVGIGKAWYGGLFSWVAVLLLLFAARRGFHPITLCLLTGVFVVATCDNPWLSVLRRPVLLFLGRISYSVYLLHGFCLWCVFRTGWPGKDSPILDMAVLIAMAGAVVFVSSLTYRFVEEPGLRLGRKMTSAKSRSGEAGCGKKAR